MIISITAKCSDMFTLDSQGISYEGYVPNDLGIGGGDYISFDLDLSTGKIVGWKPKTALDLIRSCSSMA